LLQLETRRVRVACGSPDDANGGDACRRGRGEGYEEPDAIALDGLVERHDACGTSERPPPETTRALIPPVLALY
jgi:hypothetical protein